MIKKQIELNATNEIICQQKEASNTEEFYKVGELAKKFKVSTSSIWGWVRLGYMPKPIKLTPRCTVWLAIEIDAWFASRVAARDFVNEKAA